MKQRYELRKLEDNDMSTVEWAVWDVVKDRFHMSVTDKSYAERLVDRCNQPVVELLSEWGKSICIEH